MKESHQTIGLRTLEDISDIILHSHDLHETLDNIVNIVARKMNTDVCSIYLLENDGETLVLKATRGLSPDSVDRISMKTGEGLTGLVIETKDMVTTDNAPEHPRYKYFSEAKEESFLSFLGLPLFERKSPIGVIVIQTREARKFSDDEISALRTITFQIGSIIQNARLLDSIQHKEEERAWFEQELARARNGIDHKPADPVNRAKKAPPLITGISASAGFCRGKVYILDRFNDKVINIAKVGTIGEERHKFAVALEKVKIMTIYMGKRVAELLSEDDAAIFHSHLMILEDRSFLNRITELVEQGVGATRSVHDTVQHYLQAFASMDDPYLRERSADMEDIGRRLIDAMEGNDKKPPELDEPRIIVAEDIFPSDMAMMNHEMIMGIATEKGNIYSHAAIMARSLGIPAVLGLNGLMEAADVKDEIIVDGTSGCVYINPDSSIKKEYERIEKSYAGRRRELEGLRELPALTTDGTRVVLSANIGLLSDIKISAMHGAEGVGLYRTEFPYMTRSSFPDRNEQASLYSRILEGFPGQNVNIRTLDIGGDKTLPYFTPPREENPFLGWRSIRISLEREDIFREQLAGILLASDSGNPSIMFPLVSSIDEIGRIREILVSVMDELDSEGKRYKESIPLGIMVEVPAAVEIIDFLLEEVDFVSIGTNDLIQYMLAADRNNSRVKQYYDQFHPAVIRAIKHVVDAAAKYGKKVSVCGEMGADPLNALFLVGLGVREFSLSAPGIPLVKQAVINHSITECRELAEMVLNSRSSTEVGRCLVDARKRFRLL